MNEKRSMLPTCDLLDALLDKHIEHPELAAEIEQEIRKTYLQEKTIFVLDMSGFSRIVQRYGIIHYLAMIRRMQKVVGPAVEKNGGIIIKFEADNCFAVFESPDAAVNASRDIHHDLNVANIFTADESDVHVSIGIGHGPVLLACDDLYGNEMNLASKLGEDVAERDEVLLTEAAKNKITSSEISFERFPLTISGVEMNVFRFLIAK
jgi:class 3 adenylate cyclase